MKFCKDCKWYWVHSLSGGKYEYPMCLYVSQMVDGKIDKGHAKHAEWVRQGEGGYMGGMCGVDARWFEPKEQDEKE